jgi:hypothetical protein
MITDIPRSPLSSTHLKIHPALAAWTEMGFHGLPASIQTLSTLKGKGTYVYRLNGIGNSADSVIAKLGPRDAILTERFAYQDLLPRLPVTKLQCYGFFEWDENQAWIFLEDACGEPFSEFLRDHIAVASEWVGLMHATSARERLGTHLSNHGSGYYRRFFTETRRIVSATLETCSLQPMQASLLETIVEHCHAVESKWAEIWNDCETLPKCLLHGDFINKNLRVRTVKGRLALYVMDWESASWSVPVEDIAGLDMQIYWPIVRETWPHLDLATVQRAADIGSLLKYGAWMEGYSTGLTHGCIEESMEDLRYCEAQLASARSAANCW